MDWLRYIAPSTARVLDCPLTVLIALARLISLKGFCLFRGLYAFE